MVQDMDDRVHLFGIRHHGPGSAASLVAALDALQPTAVLIEGPPEGDALIAYAAAPDMRPPVALLAYAKDDPANAVFFPFAVFSPEWQAMRWSLRQQRPVRFIDWPVAMSLACRAEEKKVKEGPEQLEPEAPEPETSESAAQPSQEAPAEPAELERDPLDRLAEVSGHADGEALWNALVESRGAAREVFVSIEEAMTALRAATDPQHRGAAAALREARREAHMRQEIRKALKEHEGPIAVVVGAWHVPALRQKIAATEDRATLKDVPKTKAEITWVPWTETRLAAASGYGAGVHSPGWYAHLWSLYEDDRARVAPEVFAATWQSKVAALLRHEGHTAATASAIEAARLAVALSALRGHATPGLEEMRDATLSALCHGDTTPFRLIEARLIVGEAIGNLDDSVPQMPLAADLALWQRRLRLKPETLEQDIALDLRTETGLAKSVLLHRLDLLGVTWGRLIDAEAGRGTFREIWRLAWAPELSVKLAEALIYGVTIEQAAAGAATARAAENSQISDLAELVRRCLLSDLPNAAEHCIAKLQAAAVAAVDVTTLMQAVPPLVSILRYGTARKMPVEALSALARALVVEVNAGITLACRNLDDAAAEATRRAMTGFDATMALLDDAHLSAEWNARLAVLIDDSAVVPLIAGLALRLLYDRGTLRQEAVATAFARSLSPAVPPKAVGQWLEGFLGSSAEVILQDHALRNLVDAWLSEPKEEDFVELLPMLRRAFSSFGMMERRRLLGEIGKGAAATPMAAAVADVSPGFEKALPLLLQILGIKSHA
jgi:uncharacterized protein DUF5682